jgi:Domain of unknown function (DUF222)
MIENRMRALVADALATNDAWTPAERIDQIAGLEAAVAMLQTLLNVEAVAYVDQRRAADKAAGVGAGTAGRGAPVEIAMARGVSRATVDYQLAFARQLVDDHPALLAACLAGQVSQPAAKYVVAETEPLTSEQRRAFDAELTDLACDLTPGEVRKAAARKVTATDPQAADRRARAARARTAIRAVMHRDGTGTLSAFLPAEQAVAAWQTLDHEARCRRGEGDERSIDQLMGDLFVERVTGQTTAADLNLEVGVVIAATSLFGIDDQPAKLVGHHGGDYGVLPAGLARQLAASDSVWARRLICDPVDGTLVSMDTKRRRFDGALRKFVLYRDGVSRRPFSSAPIYDIDHVVRYVDGGQTVASNAEGLAKSDHLLRDLPGWSVDVTDHGAANGVSWTTPTGHFYESRPPPILGWGNTSPTSRVHGGRQPAGPVVEVHPWPINAEFHARHHRPHRN